MEKQFNLSVNSMSDMEKSIEFFYDDEIIMCLTYFFDSDNLIIVGAVVGVLIGIILLFIVTYNGSFYFQKIRPA